MPSRLTSTPNINHLWAALLVEELVRQGVGLFVVCPGSRSTPLAVAVAENPGAEVLVHWDERAAGFVALGWGRATGRPAAVITTSGTAVANLLPAAVEADADGVPLLLITADRPPELRETGANQTIRQPPIFQDVARWVLDWPVPSADVSLRWVLSTAAHAVHRSRQPPGPVHLNLPFREPLAATPDGTDVSEALVGVERWASSDPPASYALPSSGRAERHWDTGAVSDWFRRVCELGEAARGVIVVGPGVWDAYGLNRIAREAQVYGWPLLRDVLAGGDWPAAAPIVSNAEVILASPRAQKALRPNVVVQIGGRPTSKRLLALLRDAAPDLHLRISPSAARQDPDSLVTHTVVGNAVSVLTSLTEPDRHPTSSDEWWSAWDAASAAAHDASRSASDSVSEPGIAQAVLRCGARVIVSGASMPIRDLEAFGTSDSSVPVAFANRGASGIDGTVATAAGVARGVRESVTLLLGDLALLHDQTSLALLRDGPPVIVVVINNDGGGIFHRLPVASGPGALDADTFERMFGTPHGLTFEHAAAQVGLAYHAPETTATFERALDTARQSGASALIEVRTNRAEQTALRARIETEVAQAVDAALAEAIGE